MQVPEPLRAVRAALVGSALVGRADHVLYGDAPLGACALYLPEVHPKLLGLLLGCPRSVGLLLFIGPPPADRRRLAGPAGAPGLRPLSARGPQPTDLANSRETRRSRPSPGSGPALLHPGPARRGSRTGCVRSAAGP